MAYVILLTDEERVVDRGTNEIKWFVRVRDAWVPAAKVEGASTELESASGPGVVWRRHTQIELPVGTRVLRIEQRPNELVRTPLEHLTKSRSSPRKTQRRLYSIGMRGELLLEKA